MRRALSEGMNNTTETREQVRQDDGKFGHGLDRLCKCGNRKGQHDAERPFPMGEGPIKCDRFRAAKAPK